MDRNLLLRGQGHTPDILECLANLSSDEVFTPPEIANQMLDLLPDEVWSNPDLKWLDPACKTGVFLREAAKRLMVGLKDAIPDGVERREHIFKNMLHGYAITELTALVSRRTLYYSKDAHGDHAIIHFDNPDGNILYERRDHTWKGKDGSRRCEQCGAPESIEYKNHTWADREKPRHCELCGGREDVSEKPEKCKGMENHAYRFIHLDEKEKQMKFDVIIGNPPYQINDGGHGASARPIYHLFVEMAKDLKPQYISFIIPARWFAGGKGLDDFRQTMLSDKRISRLVDIWEAESVFPGVEIRGGVCYFLWDKLYSGECSIVTNTGGERAFESVRLLDQYDIFVRDSRGISIINKIILRKDFKSFSNIVSTRQPFNNDGLRSNFKDFSSAPIKNYLKLYLNNGTKREIGWVDPIHANKNKFLINKWKVLIPKSGDPNIGGMIIGQPIVAPPGSICTQTYLVVGPFAKKEEAEITAEYMKSKFFRFMVSLRKISQDASRSVYMWVPLLNSSSNWTDEKLYKHFNLTEEEIAYIEATVREMS
jgi:site-specific DNA-methyltransferase (adenine-specific)